ncbi:MAG TPA: tetratricopeptide repeat protein [Holophagaceae bacterium]
MNWAYLRVEALLPLAYGLALSMAAGAGFAIRLHQLGGDSRAARRRFLRFMAWTLPLALTLATLWDARATLQGLWGATRHRSEDEYALGILRRGGQGFLKADPTKAVYWFQRAADHGQPEAQFALAQAYLSGQGVPIDPKLGLHWAQASAAGGSLNGMLLSGDLLRPSDPDRSQQFYGQALAKVRARTDAGDAAAALTLGFMYFRGQGLAPDPVEGGAWMREAARRGLPGPQRLLVMLAWTTLTPDQRQAAAARAKVLAETSSRPSR